MNAAVELKGVTKRFKDVTAVKEVDISFAHGEVYGLLGPSGSGKSTLLRIIDFLETPDRGRVSFDGVEIRAGTAAAVKKMRDIGMVLQKPVVFNRSVENNLAYSMQIRGWDDKKVDAKVDKELKRFGLWDRRKKNARTLSGGEMQRLSFARSLVFEPKMLLLDEFAANLDPKNVGILEEHIRRYSSEDSSRTVIMVTHNIFQARRLCTRLALVWDGEIVEVSETKEFFENPKDPRSSAFVKGDVVY